MTEHQLHPRPETEASGSPSARSRIRVMIADDDADNRDMLADIIQHIGTLELVGAAENADEAVMLAAACLPDVALLDVRMPLGGGPEAARGIRRRSPRTHIIALSAFADDRSVEEMLASGATSYITKDASFDDIVDAIDRSVRGDALLSDAVTRHVVEGLGTRLELERVQELERLEKEQRIRRLLEHGEGLTIAYQPIVALSSGRIVGVEALSRFTWEPKRTPDLWFAEATEVGLGTPLQVAAVRLALPALDELPVDVHLSINVDPATAASPALAEAIEGWPAERIIIELTEHAPASDYPSLRQTLDRLRSAGVRLAVDDAGAGFASLRHILELAPDIIKLDISITRDIDTERSNRALASALVGFAREIDTNLVAEGVETVEEALALRSLGIPMVQGYLMARPGPLPERFMLPVPEAAPES